MEKINLNQKWLIGVDLDGTTLNTDGMSISPFNIKVINQLITDGHIVSICTGRSPSATYEIYKTLKLNSLSVCYAGSAILHFSDKNFKQINHYVDRTFANKILNSTDIMKKIDCICLETPEYTYITRHITDIFNYLHLEFKSKYKVININAIKNLNYNTILMLVKNEINIDSLITKITKVTNYFNIYKIYVSHYFRTKSTQKFIELNNTTVSKATGIQFLLSYYKINENNCLVIGDSENDIKMLKYSKHNAVMKNGTEMAKKYSKNITKKTNDEAGLGHFLNNFFNLQLIE